MRDWFLFGCVFEAALLVLAAGLGWLLHRPMWADLRWAPHDAAFGALASLPLLVLFLVTLRSSWRPLAEIRAFLDTAVVPIFRDWSLVQLAVISLLAGLGEEVLFRGVIQGWLVQALGTIPGLVLAGVLFGCAHPLTRGYLLLAGLVGVYLGSLWLIAGNLLVPITAHAVYDFLALVYFLRFYDQGVSQ